MFFLIRKENGSTDDRVQRLTILMGIEAIYPGSNTNRAIILLVRYIHICSETAKSPELPRYGDKTDITYATVRHGRLYLVAIINSHEPVCLHPRELCTTLEVNFLCSSPREGILCRCSLTEITNFVKTRFNIIYM